MFSKKLHRENKRQRDARKTSLMLLVVIIVFLATELPFMVITVLHTVHSRYIYTLYTVHCTLYTVHCTLKIYKQCIRYTLYTQGIYTHCTLYTVHTVHTRYIYTLYTVHLRYIYTLYTAHFKYIYTLHTVHTMIFSCYIFLIKRVGSTLHCNHATFRLGCTLISNQGTHCSLFT